MIFFYKENDRRKSDVVTKKCLRTAELRLLDDFISDSRSARSHRALDILRKVFCLNCYRSHVHTDRVIKFACSFSVDFQAWLIIFCSSFSFSMCRFIVQISIGSYKSSGFYLRTVLCLRVRFIFLSNPRSVYVLSFDHPAISITFRLTHHA